MPWTFGDRIFDETTWELRSPSGVRPVPARQGRLLLHLIEHRDRLVSKNELLDRFGSENGSPVVGEEAVRMWIRRLRELIGDDGEAPRMIETRPRGYRFIAPVTQSPGGAGLAYLRARARDTGEIWTFPADALRRCVGMQSDWRSTVRQWKPTLPADALRRDSEALREARRGLGALTIESPRRYRLGSGICIALEWHRDSHMLLLDEGPEGLIYCLCPSWFAHETRLASDLVYLPQGDSTHEAFILTGTPGREYLLAILTEVPLDLDWVPSDPGTPARVLTEADIHALLARLLVLGEHRWVVVSTYFDVTR